MDLFITPLFTIGPFQIVVIVVVALIVFGPVGLGKKLGNLVKGTGQGVKEFKKALILFLNLEKSQTKNSSIFFYLGLVYFELNKFDKSIFYYKKY